MTYCSTISVSDWLLQVYSQKFKSTSRQQPIRDTTRISVEVLLQYGIILVKSLDEVHKESFPPSPCNQAYSPLTIPQGPVVQKPINANPGLKVKAFNFSCIKVFFSVNVLQSLRLVKAKTEGQEI